MLDMTERTVFAKSFLAQFAEVALGLIFNLAN